MSDQSTDKINKIHKDYTEKFFNSSVYRFYTKRECVIRIQKSLTLWLHQDEDDEINYSLNENQRQVIQSILNKNKIDKTDIETILQILNIDQFDFLQ